MAMTLDEYKKMSREERWAYLAQREEDSETCEDSDENSTYKNLKPQAARS